MATNVPPNPILGQVSVCPTTGNTSIYTGSTAGQNHGWVSIAPTNYSSPVYSMNGKGGVVFHGSNGREVSVDELINFMDIMKRRMLMLTPSFEKHEHYPALKAAYEQYLLIERMCLGDGGNE